MNQVHEQCQKFDSGKIPSGIGPKTGQVHRVHNPSQPARPGHVPRAPAAPLPRAPRGAAARLRPAAARLRAPRAPRALPSAVSWPSDCIAIQSLPMPLAWSQYNFCIVILSLCSQACCNTISAIQLLPACNTN